MRARLLIAACGALALLFAPAPAGAQQHLDEPKLDPLIGKPYEEPRRDRDVKNDDEFDNDRGWSPLRGFFGIMTYLAPEETDISLGVGPVYRPDYFGSDDFEWDVDPAVFIRARHFLFFDDSGADFAVVGFSNFSAGPSLRIVGDRKEKDNPALVGLGEVGTTFEFGGFAATTFLDRYSVRFKVRHGLKTGHRGTIVDATMTALLFRWGRVSTSVSAQTAWIGNNYADAYFSVTPAQSASSGLPVYDANAGFRDIGGSFNAYINVFKRWSLNPYITYSYIFDGIADTPIIAQYGDQNQYTAGFHLMREFSLWGRE
ncbi:MAG: MipA/OmpV family protein [Amphiplicatus sp.]